MIRVSNPEMQKAHDYVVHWSEMKAKSIGLLLGRCGNRENPFAGCIANALLEQGVPVLMTNFSWILNALSGLYSEGEEPIYRQPEPVQSADY